MNNFLVDIAVVAILLSSLGTMTHWFGFRLARVPVNSVKVFHGAPVASFFLLGTTIVIGCIPTGSSVNFDLPLFSRKSFPVRLSVILVGPAVLFVVAAACLGIPSSFHHFVSGFYQIPFGALQPRSTGFELIGRLQDVLDSSYRASIGIMAAKGAAFSLLPIGGMTTAQILNQILISLGLEEHKLGTFIFAISALFSIAISIMWISMIVMYDFLK